MWIVPLALRHPYSMAVTTVLMPVPRTLSLNRMSVNLSQAVATAGTTRASEGTSRVP